MKKIKLCLHLAHLPKRYDYTPSHHKQHSVEHIQRKGPHYAIYTDGSKSSNGTGCAAVSFNKQSQYSLPKDATVFTAELTAIILAIDIINMVKDNQNTKYVIYSDSRSAIEAIKNYSHKNNIVKQIKINLNKLYAKGLNIEICWIPAHVGIIGNEKADEAAKSAIGSPLYDIKLPAKDYTTKLNQIIKTKWQNQWDDEPINNKLKEIKPIVSFWKSSIQNDRKTEVLLTRLRLGHTRLTHSFLMSSPHGEIPRCQECDVILTVKHILCHCRNYNKERNMFFGHKTIKEILGDSDSFSIFRILKFLRSTNLISKI